jgi:hypothetical protein
MFKTIHLKSNLMFWSFETGDPLAGWGVRRTNFENLKIVSDLDIRISDFIMSIQNRLPKDWASLE